MNKMNSMIKKLGLGFVKTLGVCAILTGTIYGKPDNKDLVPFLNNTITKLSYREAQHLFLNLQYAAIGNDFRMGWQKIPSQFCVGDVDQDKKFLIVVSKKDKDKLENPIKNKYILLDPGFYTWDCFRKNIESKKINPEDAVYGEDEVPVWLQNLTQQLIGHNKTPLDFQYTLNRLNSEVKIKTVEELIQALEDLKNYSVPLCLLQKLFSAIALRAQSTDESGIYIVTTTSEENSVPEVNKCFVLDTEKKCDGFFDAIFEEEPKIFIELTNEKPRVLYLFNNVIRHGSPNSGGVLNENDPFDNITEGRLCLNDYEEPEKQYFINSKERVKTICNALNNLSITIEQKKVLLTLGLQLLTENNVWIGLPNTLNVGPTVCGMSAGLFYAGRSK